MKLRNLNRQLILNYVKVKPHTISELASLLHHSRPTIYLHLDVLEKQGLIKRKKDIKKKGAPVTIYPVEKEISKRTDKKVLEILKEIKKSQPINSLKFNEKLPLEDNEVYIRMIIEGYIDENISLSKKGEQYLKENDEIP